MESRQRTRVVRTVMVGLGNVNRNLLKILAAKRQRLLAQYGLEFCILCVADSSGVAVDEGGFDPTLLGRHKASGGRVVDLTGARPGHSVLDVLEEQSCDLVMEASPVNLQTGEPGLGITRAALGRGTSVVLANKAPLVLAFHELRRIASAANAGLAYSATVCGGLPLLNIARRDLVAADIMMLRGIFNSTSNFVLDEMADGRTYAEALTEAQRRGIAEADPSLDVDGWDTANKLVIIANSILGLSVGLDDVRVEGISAITPEALREERGRGRVIKLVATADGDSLDVEPAALPKDDFLAACSGWEMAVEIHTDIYGKMYHKLWEREPIPTAASMLRDAVNIFRVS